MYVNGRMISVETIPGMGEKMEENGGGGEFNIIYLIYCKNFCKCHNVPPPSTIIKKFKNKKQIQAILYIPRSIYRACMQKWDW
jgi:hypothetical protein